MAKANFFEEAIKETTDMRKMLSSDIGKTILEQLQPRINQLVSKNLQEMGDEGYGDEEEMDETLDFHALMQEVEEEDAPTDAPDMGDGDMGDVGMDDESAEDGGTIADMTPEDLKQMIMDALKEITGGDAGEVDATDMGAKPDGDDEMDEDGMFEGLDLDEMIREMADADDADQPKDAGSLQEQIKALKKDKIELTKANVVYKKSLQENKLTLVQMSYVNKLIVESKLTDAQIIRFSEILDKTKSIEEVKNVYNAINESLKTKAPKQVIKNQKLKEGYGIASRDILPKAPKQVVAEDPFVARMKKNMGSI